MTTAYLLASGMLEPVTIVGSTLYHVSVPEPAANPFLSRLPDHVASSPRLGESFQERFSVSRALIRASTVSDAREQKKGAANKKRSDVHAEMIEQAGQYSQRVGVIFDDQNSQAPVPRRQSFCWIVAH